MSSLSQWSNGNFVKRIPLSWSWSYSLLIVVLSIWWRFVVFVWLEFVAQYIWSAWTGSTWCKAGTVLGIIILFGIMVYKFLHEVWVVLVYQVICSVCDTEQPVSVPLFGFDFFLGWWYTESSLWCLSLFQFRLLMFVQIVV